jgi:hypothetical protein
MKYVIECEGSVYGPFDNDRLASEWAAAVRCVNRREVTYELA